MSPSMKKIRKPFSYIKARLFKGNARHREASQPTPDPSRERAQDSQHVSQQQIANPDLMLSACKTNDLPVLKRLLDQDTNPNDGPYLHVASAKGHVEAVTMLLDRGADINGRCRRGCRPIYYAVKYKYYILTSLLLDYGAAVNVVDAERMTPLHLAAAAGNSDLVALLLSHGAWTNMLNREKLSARTMAINNGHHNVSLVFDQRVWNTSTTTAAALQNNHSSSDGGVRTLPSKVRQNEARPVWPDQRAPPMISSNGINWNKGEIVTPADGVYWN